MNILITGANGFIGRHLIGTLLQEETHHIWGIARQPLALDSKYYCHLTVDLTRKNWTDVLPSPIDTVVHLAQSNRYRAQDFPEGSRDMLAVNVNSTLELLEWARKNHVKQFILSSTGNVYKPSPKLFVEDDSCFPTNMYAATKLSAEYFVQQYREFFQGIVLRLFSIYGPHQKRRLLPMIIDRIKTGGEIILASEKGIYLTPLYVSDCVEMIWRLIDCSFVCQFEIFNVSGSEILHLGEMVAKIAEILGVKPNIKIVNEEPSYLQGNNRKICDFLNYYPIVSFDEGILRTIHLYGNKRTSSIHSRRGDK